MRQVLVVGSVAMDTVRTPAGEGRDQLGGSASYFALAARLYVPVRIVAVVGDDFPESHIADFGHRGIDLTGLTRSPGRTFRWEGVYEADMNQRTTLATELNVFETFHPVLPEQHQGSHAVFLGNIDPVLQEEVLDQLREPALIALDTMNYWITSRRSELLRVLRRVHLLLLNDQEALQLTGSESLLKAAEGIRMMGPSVVVIKRGEHGVLARMEHGWCSLPCYPVEALKDPTGAGDAFAGGMIGYLTRAGSLDEQAVRNGLAHGTAVASYAVEEFGVGGLLNLEPSDVSARVRALAGIVQFDPDA
jgi:sugar/nucleoside kinase (ribokinase family)